MKIGFTIVELLAIIIILGIICALTCANMFGIYERKDEKHDDEILDNLFLAAETHNFAYPEDNSYPHFVKIEDLINKNFIDQKMLDSLRKKDFTNDYYVKITPNVEGKFIYTIVEDKSSPEICFTFNQLTKTITNYDFNLCGPNVIIPNKINNINVDIIGDRAFYNLPITSVIIPNSLVCIEAEAFSYTNIVTLTIPGNVECIYVKAFYASNIYNLTLGEGIKWIGSLAFGYNNLTSVYIPDSLTMLSGGIFASNYVVGPSAFVYKKILGVTDNSVLNSYAGEMTAGVVIPNNVTTIEKNAFNNTGISSITLPNSLLTIGEYAFVGNDLSSITVPSTITAIDAHAFEINPNLKTITINKTGATIGDNLNGYNTFRTAYTNGGMGTYTASSISGTWTKQ